MLLTITSLLPFLLFAFVASITPGPTNILVLANCARFGFMATLPLIVGACASAASIVFLAGYGSGDVLSEFPRLQIAMQVLGGAWLSRLAWKIFRAPPYLETPEAPSDVNLWTVVSLQWINPKTWMMALAVIGVFNSKGSNHLQHVTLMCLSFFLVALPCLSAWAAMGIASRRSLRTTRARHNFNRALGLLLLLSAWLGLWF